MKAYLNHKLYSYRRLWLYLHQLALAQFCVGLVTGIILSDFVWAGCMGGAILLVIVGRRSWCLLGVGLLLGSLTYVGWFGPNRMHEIERHYGQNISQVAEVILEPDLSSFDQQVVLQMQDLPQLILAALPRYPEIEVGTKIQINGKLESLTTKYEGSYLDYLKSQGIFYILSASSLEVIEKPTGIVALFPKLKRNLETQLAHYLNPQQATLLSGILLGAKQDLSQDFKLALTATGTSHIVAVSGYNVMLIVSGLLGLSGFLPRKLVFAITTLMLIMFLLLVGVGNLSAQRAVIMGMVFLLSLASGRKGALPLSLLYAVTLMLVSYPLVWRSVSWQLSVGAMLGLILFSRVWVNLLAKLPELIKTNLVATLSVMLTTLPVVLTSFGQTSFISLLANILVLPLIPLISSIGILGLVISYVSGLLGQTIFLICELLLRLVIKIIYLLGTIPWASTKDLAMGLIFFLVIFGIWLTADVLNWRSNVRTKQYVES